MTRKRRPADIAPSGCEIRVGFVSNYVVWQNDSPVGAFHSLNEAISHFPSATVTDGAIKKACELGER